MGRQHHIILDVLRCGVHGLAWPQGILVQGWKDVDVDGTDLWEYTWRAAARLSPALTPQQVLP